MSNSTMSKEDFCSELANRLMPTFAFYVTSHMEKGYSYREAKRKFLDKIEESFGTFQLK